MTAAAIGFISAGAVSIGALTAGTATIALGAAALVGTGVVVADTMWQGLHGNWSGIAHNAGSIVGGLGVGYYGGFHTANTIKPGATRHFSVASDLDLFIDWSRPIIGAFKEGRTGPGAGGALTVGAGSARFVKSGC